ncbi:MAG: hypothetical protein EOO77_42645 [Oxalobacteraceae bacterium]|nr:MAG: hypothetical protein EOO77_42645 [Oxalobacteraceae bacterium]
MAPPVAVAPLAGTTTQEITARLLFMVIRWVKCLPTFQTLSRGDQVCLLEESWKDLFLLYLPVGRAHVGHVQPRRELVQRQLKLSSRPPAPFVHYAPLPVPNDYGADCCRSGIQM